MSPKHKIIAFLRKHHVAHIACTDEDGIWCTPLFYALDENNLALIVASKESTRHARALISAPKTGGSVALESSSVGLLQGVQFEAIWSEANEDSRAIYFSAFPFARAMLPKLWNIKITYAKLTDNRLGFGKKLEYFMDS